MAKIIRVWDGTQWQSVSTAIPNALTIDGNQTLTNKTISLANNTITGNISEFNSALSGNDFATLAGSETLTNKTISGTNNTLSNIGNSSLTNSSITINGSAVSLGGSVSIPTGPTAQAVSSNITLVANYNYFVDTTAARTLTLPASPALGDTIAVYDASGSAATNNITIARNGNKINGQLDNAIIDVDQSGSIFIYTGTTLGWRFE
jgi:VCBS repeat-containing protein